MVNGYYEGTRPFVTAIVMMPRLGRAARIALLVDTGSDSTVIHPLDARRLRLNFRRDFPEARRGSGFGVGGVAEEYIDGAELRFRVESGAWHSVSLPIGIAIPTDANSRLPSLLGQDVIGQFRLICDATAGVVRLADPEP